MLFDLLSDDLFKLKGKNEVIPDVNEKNNPPPAYKPGSGLVDRNRMILQS